MRITLWLVLVSIIPALASLAEDHLMELSLLHHLVLVLLLEVEEEHLCPVVLFGSDPLGKELLSVLFV